ncbi:MAG TPA: ABC transporter ATP-binding protein [Solirubrobacterales bacterium]|nr:ABC transporter ATP-binding protein [Solirubrobacterales bacterium]
MARYADGRGERGGAVIAGVDVEAGPALLGAHGLGRTYDGFIALDAFSLELGEGELVALVGPNGAGKTTFLTLAAGLLEPSSGSIAIAGVPAGTIPARRALSYLPDTPVFYEDLSLGEHLGYVAALHGVEDAGARASELIERLGLGAWEDSLPSEFSHGMRQKASIAIALVRPFAVLLADEPFDGLDPPSRDVLFELLAEARAAGAAVVVSTHRPDVIAAASRCVGIRDGRLAYDGPPEAEALAEFFES